MDSLSGVVTFVQQTRSGGDWVRLRIGSRQWVLAQLPFHNLIGSAMTFDGEWSNKPSGRVFLAQSWCINDEFDPARAIRNIKKLLDNAPKSCLTPIRLIALQPILLALYRIGKRKLIEEFAGWPTTKQRQYTANPYLFFLNRHLDYESAEALVYLKSIPVAIEKALCAKVVYNLQCEYRNNRESLPISELHNKAAEWGYIDDAIAFSSLLQECPRVAIDVAADRVYLDHIFYLREKALKIMERHEDREVSAPEDIVRLLRSKYVVLTGGPGTGKTTLLRKLDQYCNVIYSASTGKAAQALSPAATTIHHLLGFQGGKFKVKNLPCDVLVVDEASMLDWHTLYAIVRAAPRVIFAGDPAQLPPVEGEPVFRHLCKTLPNVELTKTWRFGADTKLNVIRRTSPDTVASAVCTLTSQLHRKCCNYQIIAPLKGKICGVQMLNNSLQRILNGNSSPLTINPAYRVSDKIIVTRNVYCDGERIAANGDIGRIQGEQHGYIAVRFGDNKHPVLVEDRDISLAYAITVHKAQGSEYDEVVFVLPSNIDDEFLTDELFCVGTSRGRKTTWVVTDRNDITASRNS